MFDANLLQKRKYGTKIQLMAIFKKLSAMKKASQIIPKCFFLKYQSLWNSREYLLPAVFWPPH